MYDNSEDAMDANEAISFQTARRELARHYCEAQQPTAACFEGSVFARASAADQWETIPCTTRGVLEWLGY